METPTFPPTPSPIKKVGSVLEKLGTSAMTGPADCVTAASQAARSGNSSRHRMLYGAGSQVAVERSLWEEVRLSLRGCLC